VKICSKEPYNECIKCGIIYENKFQKYKHKSKCQNNQCNIGNQNNINTLNNNSHNVININIFGKEDLEYLKNDNYLINKLKGFGKDGIYGLSKIIDEIHCNLDKPENNTIIKPEEYGDGVYIMDDDKNWEFREFEDIRDDLIHLTEH
jgi:hypothetical protein